MRHRHDRVPLGALGPACGIPQPSINARWSDLPFRELDRLAGRPLGGGQVRRSRLDGTLPRLVPECGVDQLVDTNVECPRVVVLIERARTAMPVLPIADSILVARRVVTIRTSQRVDSLRELALATTRSAP
jgi:hypothetical protein